MSTQQNLMVRLKVRGGLTCRATGCAVLVAALLISLSVIAHAQSTTPTSQLTITVSGQGMTPASATVSSGIIHLRVLNQSSVQILKLRVARESGELVREMTAPSKAEVWDLELELGAGQFVISEVSNTSWVCHITAQAPPSNAGQPGALQHP